MGYQIQISTVEGFGSTVVDDATLTEASYTPGEGVLEAETLYYWRVKAKNDADEWGDWASSFALTPNPAPDAPSLSTPADGSSDSNQTPSFTWSEPDRATGYEIQIDEAGGDFSLPVQEDDSLESAAFTASILAAGTYIWRVRAENSAGFWGDYSGHYTLTVEVAGGAATLGRRGASLGVGVRL